MILEGGIHINKTTFTQQLADELAAIILKASRKEKVLALLLNLSMSIGCVCLAAAILAKKASPILLILVIPMVIACMKHIYTILEVSEAKISELLYNKFGNKSTSIGLQTIIYFGVNQMAQLQRELHSIKSSKFLKPTIHFLYLSMAMSRHFTLLIKPVSQT